MTRAVPIYDHQGEYVWVWVCVSECMRVFGLWWSSQKKEDFSAESAGKEGWRKGEKRDVGLFKKKYQGLFSSTLYPGTDLCWMERGVASLPWVPGRSLLLTLDWIPLSWLSPSEVFPDELSCKSTGNKKNDPLYLTHFLSSTIHCCTLFKCGKKVPFWMMSPFIERPLFSIQFIPVGLKSSPSQCYFIIIYKLL